MIFRKLGNTDIRLSVIGLGAWAIGGGGYKFGWGAQDDKDSIATIKRAVDLGINWIDTAPVYGSGHSEEILGQAIKDIRDKIFISSKCGLSMNENNDSIVYNLKRNSIRSEIDASLKRLGTDAIDLYQIHVPGADDENDEAWDTLNALKKEGKIRYAGVSNFTLEQLKRIHSILPVSFIQVFYNMLEPSIEYETLDFCRDNDIGVVVFSPMYRGLLTGTFTKAKAGQLTADDNRLSLDYFKEPFLSVNLELVEKLRPIAERNNKSVAHLSIAWVLRRHEITSAIVGARKPSQIEETTPAGDWTLPGNDKAEIDSILNKHYSLLKKLTVT